MCCYYSSIIMNDTSKSRKIIYVLFKSTTLGPSKVHILTWVATILAFSTRCKNLSGIYSSLLIFFKLFIIKILVCGLEVKKFFLTS